MCGTRNFSSVRWYSAPQLLHLTMVAISEVCASAHAFSSTMAAIFQLTTANYQDFFSRFRARLGGTHASLVLNAIVNSSRAERVDVLTPGRARTMRILLQRTFKSALKGALPDGSLPGLAGMRFERRTTVSMREGR